MIQMLLNLAMHFNFIAEPEWFNSIKTNLRIE